MKKYILILAIIFLIFTISSCEEQIPNQDSEPIPKTLESILENREAISEPVEMVYEVMDLHNLTGTALKEAIAVRGECIDTDGGMNYYVKGHVFDIRTAHGVDVCSRSHVHPDRLYEFACAKNGTNQDYIYDCPNGCTDGACME